MTTKFTLTTRALKQLRWRCSNEPPGTTLGVAKLFLVPCQEERGPEGVMFVKSWQLMAKLGGGGTVALAEVTAESGKD